MSNVLILAREEVVAALLGLLVELRGLEPSFADGEEPIQDLIGRLSFDAVVIDCDHPACASQLLDTVKSTGAKPILFSPSRRHAEVLEVAKRHGLRSFTLPADPDTIGRLLEA